MSKNSTAPNEPCPTTPGVYENLSFDTYTKIDAVNASSLKNWLISPKYAKFRENNNEDSDALTLGRAIHARLLEDDFHDQFASLDDSDLIAEILARRPDLKNVRNSKDYKEAFDLWKNLNAHKTILKSSQMDAVIRAKNAIFDLPEANDLRLDEVQKELTLVWKDGEFGILCKARLDIFDGPLGRIIDLKSIGKRPSIKNIEREIDDRSYDLQCAWYRRAVIQCELHDDPHVDLLFTQTCDESDAAWVGVDQVALDKGMFDARLAITYMKHAKKTGEYRGVCPRRTTVSLTPWAMARYEQQLTEGGAV